jgi:hypothetical protein
MDGKAITSCKMSPYLLDDQLDMVLEQLKGHLWAAS